MRFSWKNFPTNLKPLKTCELNFSQFSVICKIEDCMKMSQIIANCTTFRQLRLKWLQYTQTVICNNSCHSKLCKYLQVQHILCRIGMMLLKYIIYLFSLTCNLSFRISQLTHLVWKFVFVGFYSPTLNFIRHFLRTLQK